ncbi:hypothetical protein [Novosphingobium sp. 9]|uniref:hypothetical protein n=1 Tax=Novosphingobium sp. 9 TaxID=2025349 RepID=UPI0021B5C35C|nr:hypothetical protein [Novosphingobium sp. 9]
MQPCRCVPPWPAGLNDEARQRLREAGDLGEDVRVQVERGTRDFATGDRVMFLKNERSLGVKNGTLGTVRSVNALAMGVTLDDGTCVAFDLKDYDRLDHGYAATLHKAQGMTVDRVHVLATPGLDRHSAYVALTRHRAGVELHYGQDDFADHTRLARALSRDRGKDMATDYGKTPEEEAHVRQVEPAGRTSRSRFDGLRLPSGPLIDPGKAGPVHAPPAKRESAARTPDTGAPRKGRFDGLVLKLPDHVRRTLEPEPNPASASAPQLSAEAQAEARAMQLREERTEALKRHARAVAAVFEAREAGQRASPEQWSELEASRTHFEALRPYGAHDAEKAYVKEPELAHEAA